MYQGQQYRQEKHEFNDRPYSPPTLMSDNNTFQQKEHHATSTSFTYNSQPKQQQQQILHVTKSNSNVVGTSTKRWVIGVGNGDPHSHEPDKGTSRHVTWKLMEACLVRQ